MESIGGYASDEESSEKDTLTQDGSKGEERPELDNYDNIQMDMSEDSNSNSVFNVSRGSAKGRDERTEDAALTESSSRDSRLSSSNGDRRLSPANEERRSPGNGARRQSPGKGERRSSTDVNSDRSREKRQNPSDWKHRSEPDRSRTEERKREPDSRPKDRKPDHKGTRRRSKSPEKDRRKDSKGRSPASGHIRPSPSSSKGKRASSLRKDEKVSSSPRRDEKKRNGSPRRHEKRSRSPLKDEKRSRSPRKDEKKRSRSPRKDEKKRSRSPRKDEKKRSRSPRKDEKKRSRSPRRIESKKASPPRRDEKKRSSTPRKDGDRKRSCSPRKEDSKRSKRSPERFHRGNRGGGRFDKKPSKISILERLGISVPGVTEFPLGVTAPQLAQRALAAQAQLANGAAGGPTALPSYYNPAAMNPARYAEQIQKRRLLWGNKPEAKVEAAAEVASAPVPGSNNWEATTFRGDQEGKMTAKFKRLMGIKEPGDTSGAAPTVPPPEGDEILRKQEEMFQSMEMQYEVARVATHTHRGLGLGFGAFQYPR